MKKLVLVLVVGLMVSMYSGCYSITDQLRDVYIHYTYFGVVIHDTKIFKDSVGGVSAGMKIFNTSNKTIKYITVTMFPYNAVGDIQECSIRRYSQYNLRITGPIEPKTGNNYYTQIMWYNYSITRIDYVFITIEFMDGTISSSKNLDMNQIILTNEDDIYHFPL